MERSKGDDTAGSAAEPNRASEATPLRNRFAAPRAAYPLPPATGEVADKAFFDELSGKQP
jgi:hypothetical protein